MMQPSKGLLQFVCVRKWGGGGGERERAKVKISLTEKKKRTVRRWRREREMKKISSKVKEDEENKDE
jgi:DNA-binding PadR family transcriptional regulator